MRHIRTGSYKNMTLGEEQLNNDGNNNSGNGGGGGSSSSSSSRGSRRDKPPLAHVRLARCPLALEVQYVSGGALLGWTYGFGSWKHEPR
jgi:hypothetical protein